MWLKYVDPEELEGERYEVYEDVLARLEAVSPIGDRMEHDPDFDGVSTQDIGDTQF